MKSHDWLDHLRNVAFPFIPLESTQSHSPGQQAGHMEQHSWTSLTLPSGAPDLTSQIHSLGGVTETLHCVNCC